MIESILQFIEHNAEWASVIVFIVAFLESIAIVGLLIPGWVLLVGIGTLIGLDVLSFYPIAIAAYLGAVIGEYLSYLLGYYYHEKVLAWPFVARHQTLIDKSHLFFEKHGISGVFIGRFFGPTRAIVPLLAGISEMRKRTFFWVNLISGLIWAPIYLIPGILVGTAANIDGVDNKSILLMFGAMAITATFAWNYSSSWWKEKEKSQESNNPLGLIKMILAWSILFVLALLTVKQGYLEVLKEIFLAVYQKL